MVFLHLLSVIRQSLTRAAMKRMHRMACAFARQELPLAPMPHGLPTGRR